MGLLATVYRAAAGVLRLQSKGDALRFPGATSGQVDVKAPATPTSWTMTLPGAAPASNGYVLTGNTDGTTSWTAASGGSAQWESTGGFFQAKAAELASGDSFKLVSKETDGASAVAHILDTANAISTNGGRILSVRNNGSEYFAVLGSNTSYAGIRIADPVNSRHAIVDTQGSAAGFGSLRYRDDNAGGGSPTNVGFHAHGSGNFSLDSSSYDSAFKVKAGTAAIYNDPGFFLDATKYYDGDSYLNKTATTDGEMRWFYDGVKAIAWGDVYTTTDATTTTVWSQTIADNSVHIIEVLVVARRTDAAGRWSGRRRVTVYRAGGAATIEGTPETIGTDVANGIAPTVTLDVSSNDVRVRVTGEASKTIRWRAHVSKVHA